MNGKWMNADSAPRNGKSILMVDAEGNQWVNWWDETYGWNGNSFSNPTHWRELPMPPGKRGGRGVRRGSLAETLSLMQPGDVLYLASGKKNAGVTMQANASAISRVGLSAKFVQRHAIAVYPGTMDVENIVRVERLK